MYNGLYNNEQYYLFVGRSMQEHFPYPIYLYGPIDFCELIDLYIIPIDKVIWYRQLKSVLI